MKTITRIYVIISVVGQQTWVQSLNLTRANCEEIIVASQPFLPNKSHILQIKGYSPR